ncbi:MAG: gliding motility-associated C-terminal domain-containing protein [Bacteroidota bacterium]
MNKVTSKLAILLFFLSFYTAGVAQIQAPTFQCVVNDTLFWQPATNGCGPFESYEIFFSANEDGPYELLATVTDQTQNFFYHSDANNQTWFYYLASAHDCLGQQQLFSDTLDNLIPLAGPLEFVSVDGNNVEISWSASPSPETIGYVVSRNTTQGTTILDTIFDTTFFLDTTADPSQQSEVYFVVALDACGNKSLVIPPHQTILLDFVAPDACNPGLQMNWNAYQNWVNGVGRYDIFVGANGATPELVGSADGAETSFTYFGGNDGDELCFYVEAVENVTSFRSTSNLRCVDISILQPIRDIELLGASVAPDGTVELEWYWDPTALLVTSEQGRQVAGDDVVTVIELGLSSPLTAENFRADANADAQNRAYVYTIFGTDECGNMVASNESRTPFLRGVITDEGNVLDWDLYTHAFGEALNYTLVRVDGAGETVVFSGISNDLSFLDALTPALEGGEVCYYLEVEVDFTLASGEVVNRILRSNTVCLVPTPKVFVPNVFAPNGLNNTFRPQLSFGTLADYELNIYDRWGGQVFQSSSLDMGWDGRRQGELMPQGVYLYFIRLQPEGGEAIDLQGDVMLLR